jgi:hypothetical protein
METHDANRDWYGGSQTQETRDGGSVGRSQTDILIGYTGASELFHTPDQQACATFWADDHWETWPVEGKRYELYLRRRYFEDYGKAPKAQALMDTIATIAARAIFGGSEEEVFVRVAGYEGAVYIDLASDAWEAIQVTPLGWQVISDPPIKFTRSKNSASLPYPVPGGSVEELKRFLNIDEQHFKLVVGWLIGAFNPQGPYPLLETIGWQGTAKSTLCRLLVSLSDPAVVPLRALPTNERDLAIAASGRWVLAYDNVSYIRPEISDAMCRLSTGGGFGTRRLYSNDEEMIFDAKRPQIVNGINPVVFRGDLQERSLQVLLHPIPPDKRRQEREFWKEFEDARSRIFGALLDAVSCALRKRDQVRLEESPRMADFATWVTAAEEALGWEPGDFTRAYESNRMEASEALLENDPVATAIKGLLDRYPDGEWSGTSEKLLEKLNWRASEEIMRSKAWPKAPNHLSRHLNRIAPALKEAGIEYLQREEGREKRKIKTLRKVGLAQSADEGQGAGEDHGETPEGDSFDAEDEDGFNGGVSSELLEEEVDYLGELAKLGWFRAETISAAEDPSEDYLLNEDPVARKLRHEVGIYHRDISEFEYYPDATPLVVTAEDVLEWEGKNKTEEELRSVGWPATPAEMSAHLRKLIPLLQAEPRRFWDPGFSEWYGGLSMNHPSDLEKVCKEARLHAELWRREGSSEELWVLVAFEKGRRVPDEAIERAVWFRATDQSNTIKASPEDEFKF